MKKKKLLLLFIPICLSLSGNTLYVSPGGKDSNPGTLSQPFLTINKAWSKVSAGDIIYIRGGRYTYAMMGETVLSGKSGMANNLIKIWNYPGESPIIDFSATTFSSQVIAIFMDGANYVHLKGIRITSINQPHSGAIGSPQYGLLLDGKGASNCIFEQMETDHIGGWGVVIGENCSDIEFLNCDSHNNADPYTANGDPYGWSDGFQSTSLTSTNITFNGCRSWENSDDGWDLRGCNGVITIENCWSFRNGFREDGITKGGDGEGFKLGGKTAPSTTSILRTVKNCLAFDNSLGFSPEPDLPENELGVVLINCVAYNNSNVGINFQYGNIAIVRNNIIYNNKPYNTYSWGSNVTHDHNNLDIPITVTDADFLSVNSDGMDGPRQEDGSLPVLNFLKPVKGSRLIDAGVDVGLPFDNKAPDLGAFEFQSGLPAPSPVYISSVIENSSPSLLEINFDLSLDNLKVPAKTSFNVMVNLQNRTINSVSVSGKTVKLNLATSVVFGDLVTLSYSKPSINSIQTVSGGEAQNFSNKSVTNNCKDLIKPNNPPEIDIDYPLIVNSGFVYDIDATSNCDPNNDPLTIDWTVPTNVSVSSINNEKIQFLAPVIENTSNINFRLKVGDGDTLLSKDITIKIIPYKHELTAVRITNIKASDYQAPDYPYNILDGNTLTKWASNGNNKWLCLKLAEPFKISYIVLAFLYDQHYKSYFDIYASKDSLIWEPVLINYSSCNFSGDKQIFDFPPTFNDTEYSYLKYIGHGNSINNWNNLSEFKIFGTLGQHSGSGITEKRKVIIYPNPTRDYLNIFIEEPSLNSDMLKIFNISGKVVFEKILNPIIKTVQIPLNLESGVYIVGMYVGNSKIFDQKLFIIN